MTTSQQSILLIEDDHDIRVSIRQTLEDAGHDVFSAANGRDALFMLKKISTPRLIILDLLMPIMTGEEFLEAINGEPDLRTIPILIVSCHQDRVRVLDTLPHLLKPLDLDSFVVKVKECLENVTVG